MQLCEIYLRKGTIYVVSQSLTGFGVGISIGPMFKVESKLSREVGESVVNALESSVNGIAQPDNIRQLQKELFRFTGAKNWSDLVKTAKHASVTCISSTVAVTPCEVGKGGAFIPAGSALACERANSGEIGDNVLKALDSCP